ncbi:SUN domain-containing ossification factor isoform X1 [Harmonia axyridis]|uniref:SUN domain-containing ossification factor isoform X1 n=1 Tax=Harmonia axyridis TaxID=115357 RepID=UPI001E2799B4|nr:SUN domain-containing ossification factor isoform X1 [Harmonia axyridis]
MKRSLFSGKTISIVFILSCLVSGIVSIQEDVDKQPKIPSENYSTLNEYGEKSILSSQSNENNIEQDNFTSNLNINNDIVGVLAEVTSKNTGTLNDITTEGATVIASLPSELKVEVDTLSASIISNQDNNTNNNDTSQTPDVLASNQKGDDREELNETNVPFNETKDIPEEIPSFSEWAQKRLEEAEKNFINESSNLGNNGKLGTGVKLGWKNYASPDCGAKVVAANPEAVSASSVISPSREEYKLNVCTNRIWFIVELCEAIQAKKIDIANFELFSSTPKEFTVSIGDRFPSREWTTVGQFTAKDERDVQSFDLNPHLFGRYIKVDVKSHHGSQHYCPISLFRVYGISELEVLQKEELAHVDDDDMDDNEDSLKIYSDGLTKNMLNSATNVVYSMIKKAAEVLGTKSNETDKKREDNEQFEYSPLINTCSTPSHRIVCTNCNDILFGQVYELLSCQYVKITKLEQQPLIHKSLMNSHICQSFGLNLNKSDNHTIFSKSFQYVEAFFSEKILAAMCNTLAVSENKAVLNNSQQLLNSTKTADTETVDEEVVETTKIAGGIEQSIDVDLPENNSESQPTDALKIDLSSKTDLPKVTCSTSLEYSSQIKPTKTVTLDVSIQSSNALSGSETDEIMNHVTKVDTPSEANSAIDVKVQVSDFEDNQEILDTTGPNSDITTISPENMDHIEHYMTDINNENGPSTATPVSSGNNPADRQKESVFLRLSNRIKALERNVSLSSQYLEELSRRYKKQVEEMQKLEKTMQSILEDRKKLEDRSKQIEERLEYLVVTLEKWPTFIFWFFTTVTIFCGVCWICGGERQKIKIDSSKDIKRRKSVDIITTKDKKKTRRPSDQALKIVRSSLIAEERKLSLERRRKKRSNKGLKRSNSINELDINGYRTNYPDKPQNSHEADNSITNNPGDWVEENRRLLEIVNLDESENSSLDQFGTIMEQDFSPYHTKTAVDRRSHRISSQFIKPNTNGDRDFSHSVPKETAILGDSQSSELKNVEKKSSLNSKLDESNRKKEKKSLRSVLKNVFT